jgi:glutamyl-Q tRNA(Asp) synthetase
VLYRGRFAPSPTGPLHFGSLVAAVASYLEARTAAGEWLIRIEDLDTPRVVPGSADLILRTLETLQLHWDGPVLCQSSRTAAYQEATNRLLADGRAFQCSCTRSEIEAAQTSPRLSGEEARYPGWCRNGVKAPERALAVRFRVDDRNVEFTDKIQGQVSIDLTTETGDFVIRRRDGLFAYQLAVVVDDDAQGISHVVRGVDLLNSTPRQLLLQRALGLRHPEYAHVPVVTDENKMKLSKSAGAGALNLKRPSEEIWRALRFLRQSPPLELRLSSLPEVWDWAARNWQVHPLRGLREARDELL